MTCSGSTGRSQPQLGHTRGRKPIVRGSPVGARCRASLKRDFGVDLAHLPDTPSTMPSRVSPRARCRATQNGVVRPARVRVRGPGGAGCRLPPRPCSCLGQGGVCCQRRGDNVPKGAQCLVAEQAEP